jgi:GNAT superfamily N-acetyltransferase
MRRQPGVSMIRAKKRGGGAHGLTFHPLTTGRWSDFEKLFGASRGCDGCWCMWWKLGTSEFNANRGEANRKAMRAIVRAGKVPGILAYAGDEPVGWCAAEPRAAYPRLARSRLRAPVDAAPVWSVTCFFVAPAWRRRGVTVRLLEAAADHVRRQGGRIVEGYPNDPQSGDSPDAWVYTGLVSAFRSAGFKEVARRSGSKPIMRRSLAPTRTKSRTCTNLRP